MFIKSSNGVCQAYVTISYAYIMLPKEAIQEFKQIYEKVFKEQINDAEASRRANNLVELYQTIFSHSLSNKKEEVKDYGSRSKS